MSATSPLTLHYVAGSFAAMGWSPPRTAYILDIRADDSCRVTIAVGVAMKTLSNTSFFRVFNLLIGTSNPAQFIFSGNATALVAKRTVLLSTSARWRALRVDAGRFSS